MYFFQCYRNSHIYLIMMMIIITVLTMMSLIIMVNNNNIYIISLKKIRTKTSHYLPYLVNQANGACGWRMEKQRRVSLPIIFEQSSQRMVCFFQRIKDTLYCHGCRANQGTTLRGHMIWSINKPMLISLEQASMPPTVCHGPFLDSIRGPFRIHYGALKSRWQRPTHSPPRTTQPL